MRADPFGEREQRVANFLLLVESDAQLQRKLMHIQTLDELLAISSEVGCGLDKADIVLSYRELNQSYWPWHDMPMQVRRHFVHAGRLLKLPARSGDQG